MATRAALMTAHTDSLALLFDPQRSTEACAERLLETTHGNRRRAYLLARAWGLAESGTRWQEVANLLSSEAVAYTEGRDG